MPPSKTQPRKKCSGVNIPGPLPLSPARVDLACRRMDLFWQKPNMRDIAGRSSMAISAKACRHSRRPYCSLCPRTPQESESPSQAVRSSQAPIAQRHERLFGGSKDIARRCLAWHRSPAQRAAHGSALRKNPWLRPMNPSHQPCTAPAIVKIMTNRRSATKKLQKIWRFMSSRYYIDGDWP